MKILDLSQTLSSEMPVYPQDPDFLLKEILNSEKDDFTLSILNTGLHAGTHLDAPYHFYSSGRKILEIPLHELIGTVKIIDVKNISTDSPSNSDLGQDTNIDSGIEIKASAFKNVEKGDIVVLKTGWSFNWGLENYFTHNPYLSEEAAGVLVERKVRGLAIDGPSVDKFGETIIHEKMLFNNVWIVENLRNLDLIPESENKDYNRKINNNNNNKDSLEFFFIPLPLKSEASPIRAFVRIND